MSVTPWWAVRQSDFESATAYREKCVMNAKHHTPDHRPHDSIPGKASLKIDVKIFSSSTSIAAILQTIDSNLLPETKECEPRRITPMTAQTRCFVALPVSSLYEFLSLNINIHHGETTQQQRLRASSPHR